MSLQVRVGVATGLVVVGATIGEGESQEQVVVGETPNLAARLQSLEKPNTLVVSSTTRRLAAESFELSSLGEHTLKGFAEPVDAWIVSGLRDVDADGSPDHHTAGVLVDREHELELLRLRWHSA